MISKNNVQEEIFELPIQIPPPIKSYLPISIISNIAFANRRDNSWVLNNFIQLFIPDNTEKLESFPFQDFMYFDQNLFQVNNVNDNNHIFKSDRIISELIYWIRHNNYIVVYVDEYEIPFTRFYKKHHILHSHFIYGYDECLQVFFATNFMEDNKIGKFTIGFNDLQKAIFSESTLKLFEHDITWGNRNTLHKVILIRYLANRQMFYNHGINKEYILNELYNYWKSNNSSNYCGFFTGQLKGTWGISVYQKIIEILEEKPEELDYRMFHVLYEHKWFMMERLRLFSINSRNLEALESVFKNADRLRFLCIKYQFNKNKDILQRMINLLKDTREEEMCILSDVLSQYY